MLSAEQTTIGTDFRAGRDRVEPRRTRGGRVRFARLLPLSAAVFGALCFLVLTDGGRVTRQSDPLIVQIDRLAERLGFGLEEAWISGHRKTADTDIIAALAMDKARSLLGFGKEQARRRLEMLPWIAEARVMTVWPHRVEVQVREYKPFAVWRHADHDVLIARDGRQLARVGLGSMSGLPLIAGTGAPAHAAGLMLDLLAVDPDVASNLLVAERVGQRRWTLHLKDGRRIHLPEKNASETLRGAFETIATTGLAARDFQVIDLRNPAEVRLLPAGVAAKRGQS